MSDPTRLLDDKQVASATSELLRALKPPEAVPPGVQTALAEQLSGLVAQGAAPAAAGAVWLKVALLSVAVAGSGTALYQLADRAAPAPQPAAPKAAAPAAAPLPAASVAPAPAAAPVEAVERPRVASAPSSPAEPRDKLAEEEALLEQARTLVGGSPARALSLLRSHQARFPGGQLAAERMYLSVDCLRRLGRRGEAEREVDALVARYPNSAYARRAPLLLDATPR